MRKIIIIAAVALLITACGSGKAKRNTAADKASEPKVFPTVTKPSYIVDPEEEVRYMAAHYWDKFDFADTTYINDVITEDAFVYYIDMLTMLPDPDTAKNSMTALFTKAQKNPAVYNYFWDLADKYLYDPLSPMRNGELYIPVMESVIANPAVDSLLKIAPKERLVMAMRNRIGHKALDFTYTTSKGARGSLYGIKADYMVIFFYNLGCSVCQQVREGMIAVLAHPDMQAMMDSGRLRILALYPDEHMEYWDKYLGDIPSEWINAYDHSLMINRQKLYDLKAIPSLYLLDKNKKVLAKDFDDPRIIYFGIMQEEDVNNGAR